jgi:lysyl endopeptidase
MKPALIVLLAVLPMTAVATATGIPFGLEHGVVATETLGAVNVPKPAAPEHAPEPGRPVPYRFALPVTLDLHSRQHGQWDLLPDGRRLWRLRLQGEDALSLSVVVRAQALPSGTRLVLHDVHGDQLRGPYGPEDFVDGTLWSPLVSGTDLILSLALPAHAAPDAHVIVTKVHFGILPLQEPAIKSGPGACNVNILCPAGADWRNEARAVALVTIGGQFSCSGTLVNNTERDLTPYFLTANHCVSTPAQAASTVYYWNFQNSSCGARGTGKLSQNQSGAQHVATSDRSDFTLLRLNSTPPSSFNVHYAGWDHRNVAPVGVTGIHHPRAGEKAISHSEQATRVTESGRTAESGQGSHLRVVSWDVGTTEPGSSGSGLWDRNRRLVGQLSVGASGCDSDDPSQDNNLSDWYGRLHESWHGSTDPAASLRPHLDPIGSGVDTLDGMDPPKDTTAPPAGSGGGNGGSPWPVLLLLAGAAILLRRAAENHR